MTNIKLKTSRYTSQNFLGLWLTSNTDRVKSMFKQPSSRFSGSFCWKITKGKSIPNYINIFYE